MVNTDDLRKAIQADPMGRAIDGDLVAALDELDMLRTLLVDLEGTVGTREAELGEVHRRLEDIDRARIVGIRMCQEKDEQIAKLTDARRELLAVMAADIAGGIAARGSNTKDFITDSAIEQAELILAKVYK